jgi:hypothetical protein
METYVKISFLKNIKYVRLCFLLVNFIFGTANSPNKKKSEDLRTELGFSLFPMFSISSITKVFKYFEVYKRYLDLLNVKLLHLYFQNYIIMEEMERMRNGEDPSS